jgi:glycosyltransferase involved in cell wall biosynthesis
MKIVMLTDIYDEKMQYQDNLFAKYYTKHGHDVTILASTVNDTFDYYAGREAYDPSAPSREYWDGRAKVIKLPYSIRFLSLRRLRGVGQVLERERPDFIFSHDIHLNLSDAVSYRRVHPECRIILDYHADSSNSGRSWLSRLILHKWTRKPLLQRSLADIEKVFPVVPASADFLHDVYGVPRDRMELLPLAADTDLATATRQAHVGRTIRARMGIPVDAVVVFTGGKLEATKRTHLLLEAFHEVNDPRLHLLVVGDVAARTASYTAVLAERARGHRRIHLVGWVQAAEVYGYMDACDFAVFPASQSVLWQQALSMGLPLIVGHVGVQDPSYMNLHDSLVIMREDEISASAIAQHIRFVLDNPNALAERQAGALRTTAEFLNYDKLVAQTLRSR